MLVTEIGLGAVFRIAVADVNMGQIAFSQFQRFFRILIHQGKMAFIQEDAEIWEVSANLPGQFDSFFRGTQQCPAIDIAITVFQRDDEVIIVGLIQGVLGGAIFSVLGLNSPLLWGSVMAILAFLPIFGIGLVMIPTAVLLAINDRIGEGIFLFVFYIILSFSIEYIVKPKMVGSEVQMHTLLVFLAILGGLSVYGVLGIIYGPLIITAFLTLSDIYLKKYDQSYW